MLKFLQGLESEGIEIRCWLSHVPLSKPSRGNSPGNGQSPTQTRAKRRLGALPIPPGSPASEGLLGPEGSRKQEVGTRLRERGRTMAPSPAPP